jgi:hypothetical protein
LVCEAAAMLLLARILIAWLPFHSLASKAFPAGERNAGPSPAQAHTSRRIRAAIRRAAGSWAVCLPQALAANWMLHRRGIGSTVLLGVRRDPSTGRMSAHAWLRVGHSILIGGPHAHAFHLVAELPLRREPGRACP